MINAPRIGIIGGGIVGLATAHELGQRFPSARITLLEKEPDVARHQSGHNSGVLHSGIYYRPGSSKAKSCRAGKEAMEAFCEREGIPYERCGKVIVASDTSQLSALEAVYARGQQNGVSCRILGAAELGELEPHAAGVAAIHVPEAGIVDYVAVCQRFARRVTEAGGEIKTNTRLIGVVSRDALVLETTAGELEVDWAVNCAGLFCDRVAKMAGITPEAKIVPFRGEYYLLADEASHLCRSLIYPVPDPRFPFLGVHLTRRLNGHVDCGPNAVLAFAREGYTKGDIHPGDLAESLLYPGFMRLAWRFWRAGVGEMWRSFSKAAFVRALQRLVPELRAEHLVPAPAGVRAQALSAGGALIDDFVFQRGDRFLHVINAPSPAATASINIARLIVDEVAAGLE